MRYARRSAPRSITVFICRADAVVIDTHAPSKEGGVCIYHDEASSRPPCAFNRSGRNGRCASWLLNAEGQFQIFQSNQSTDAHQAGASMVTKPGHSIDSVLCKRQKTNTPPPKEHNRCEPVP